MEVRPGDLFQLKKELHNPALFEAVRRYLADESGVPETGTA